MKVKRKPIKPVKPVIEKVQESISVTSFASVYELLSHLKKYDVNLKEALFDYSYDYSEDSIAVVKFEREMTYEEQMRLMSVYEKKMNDYKNKMKEYNEWLKENESVLKELEEQRRIKEVKKKEEQLKDLIRQKMEIEKWIEKKKEELDMPR